MIIKGNKSNREYTSQEQLDVFNKLVHTISDVKEDIKAMNDSIADAKNEYCEEFWSKDEDKVKYTKETKKMIDLEVIKLSKEDATTENAVDRMIRMREEAGEESLRNNRGEVFSA